MKKLFLSASVVVLFVVYALYQRYGNDDVQVVAPKTTVPPQQSGNTSSPSQSITYKDGSYTGSVTDAYYGNVQVKVTISGGKISDVQFLDYPHDRRTSEEINQQAMPYLKTETIQAQSAQVDVVSGATQTSEAFQQSLQSALNKAKS